jgi:hypothetical protein
VSECVGGDVEDPKRERRTGESKESEPRRRRADLRVPGGSFQKDRTPGSGFAGPRRKVPEGPHARERSHIPRPDFIVLRDPAEITQERPKAPEASTAPDKTRMRVTEQNFLLTGSRAIFCLFPFIFVSLLFCVLVRVFYFFLNTRLGYRLAGDLASKRRNESITKFFLLLLCRVS